VKPYWDNGVVQLYQADAREIPLPDQSVHCCVTSPPYWGLRDYGLGPEALGQEPVPEEYVDNLVTIFREVRRVLRGDGTLWLNLGDSYCSSPGQRGSRGTREGDPKYNGRDGRLDGPNRAHIEGLKPKDLVGIPWMVAFALRADGWYLRTDIIWSKPNPMPESVTDRPTRAHEYLFLFSKSATYYYDAGAIKEPAKEAPIARWKQDIASQQGSFRGNGGTKTNGAMKAVGGPKKDKQRGHGRRHEGFNSRWDNMTKAEQAEMGANKRTVWEIATRPYPKAHIATFPEELVEPCILAGSPIDGTVLDPLTGTAVTCACAQRLGRRAVGVDLKVEYLDLAVERLQAVPLPLGTG